MADTKTPLEEDRFYHIYNHAVGNERLFSSEKNYLHFLKLCDKYLSGFVDVYAYCLMPNHFHFIIKVKSLEEIMITDVALRGLQTPRRADGVFQNIDIPKIISKQFSHLFNSYAQAYNKQQNRKGSLFNNRYKRKQITTDAYLVNLIHYIHYNPIEANLCNSISDWKYSSYNAILSGKNTSIARDDIINLFTDKQNFIYCHNVAPKISGIE